MNTTFPQTEINVEALENVKTRLYQLQESILFFLRSINPDTTPGTVSWTELHSKFNVLIAKYLHLTNILNDPHSTLLQSYTVFPNEPPGNDQQAQNLGVLLRTKLFPELQQELDDRTKDGTVPGLETNGAGSDTTEERKILAGLKLKSMMHDALCRAADEIFENQRDMVHTKVRYESDDEHEDQPENSAGSSDAKTVSNTGGKQKTHTDDILQVDNFAIGITSDSSNSVRYMDDWGGITNEADGYSSGTGDADDDDDEELDDHYFEMRRQEAAEDNDDDIASENGSIEIESESEVESEVALLQSTETLEDPGEEVEEVEDEFMEVVPENEAAADDADQSRTSDMVIDTFDDEDDSAEEDMEEIDLL
ncbi:hypothetical protein BGX28_004864 [Mortierella sp. GBA30]|nr:hypothetical protein BGX28_004864 [Mortierella sp. GBA30]